MAKMNREETKQFVDETLGQSRIVVFSKSYCPYCTKAKKALLEIVDTAKLYFLEIEDSVDMNNIQDELARRTGARSVPRVFVDGEFIGGGDQTAALAGNGELLKMLQNKGIV